MTLWPGMKLLPIGIFSWPFWMLPWRWDSSIIALYYLCISPNSVVSSMASHGARFQREKVEDNYNFTWQANSHFNLSSVPDRSKKIEFEKVSSCPVIEEQTNRWFNTNNTPRPKNGSYCLWRLMKIQVWKSYCTTLRLCSQGAQLNCENHQEHVIFFLLDFAFPSSSWE